jgi:mRNA-degrading endonuclease RelE of RelBE toxin-antitoxin system
VSYLLAYTGGAHRDLKRLDASVSARVIRTLEHLADSNEGDVIRLTGVHPPQYRLREGDWRIRFTRDDAAATLTVPRVLPRGEAYR